MATTAPARPSNASTARHALPPLWLRKQACGTILGHYSKRYTDDTVLLQQAREVFPATILSTEGMTIDLNQV